MGPTEAIGLAGVALGAIGLGMLALALFSHPPALTPLYGMRGLQRQKALEEGGLFASLEPVIRFLAGIMSRLSIREARVKIDKLLIQSGDRLGITPDEFLAMSFITGVAGVVLGALVADFVQLPDAMMFFAGAVGAGLPYFRTTGEAQLRMRLVNRSLPPAIDLAALAMGAGLDFPGALRQIIDKGLDKDEPLHTEFSRIIQVLELGRTRKEALLEFAERVPTEAVTEFVSSVIQAEEKGNPLSTILKTQAGVLRSKRTVAAEESAARAGVMMMIPLLMIFCSIILLLIGPFLLQGQKAGF